MKNRDRIIATYGVWTAVTIMLTPLIVDIVVPEAKSRVYLGIAGVLAAAAAAATGFIWQDREK